MNGNTLIKNSGLKFKKNKRFIIHLIVYELIYIKVPEFENRVL